ncbi:hypothetical protein F4779DRAFT_285812 [Xylariaceae sp. FL0662B]|nr:hypothetical protein F4779DRAFT_285812 [Xylariaceae sp. FL0662B]
MSDKRSSRLDDVRSQKKVKTFPPVPHDGTGEIDQASKQEEIDPEIDRRSTAISLQATATNSETGRAEHRSPRDAHSRGVPGSLAEEEVHDDRLSRPTSSGPEDDPKMHDPEPRIEGVLDGDGEQGSISASPQESVYLAAKYRWDDFDEDDFDAPRVGSTTPQYEGQADLIKELGPWEAPPEPLRPRNPYKRGQSFMIRKHIASPPFGERYPYYAGLREHASERELRTKTLVELCLEHPPMKGQIVCEDAPRRLHIVEGIRVKDDGGAQLVTCRLADRPDEYVAKIYDPLYYGFHDRMWSDQPRDVTWEADHDYCREAAAYLELDGTFGGKETPKYHGSWTFQMPLDLPDGAKTRDVRMILIERTEGRSMLDVRPDPFPDAVRLETVARIMEAFSRITYAGVRHGDISQRNIMLCDGDAPNTIGRVVIIDFNFAVVERLDDFELEFGTRLEKADKPQNPADDCWDGGFLYGGFGEWFPRSWEYRPRPLQDWLNERWGKSQDFTAPKEHGELDEENIARRYVQF